MKPTVIDVLIAAESSWRGMADELQELHYLKGAQFINQLKLIIYHGEFSPVEGENDIYSAISEQSDDFDNLINAARKAVCIYEICDRNGNPCHNCRKIPFFPPL